MSGIINRSNVIPSAVAIISDRWVQVEIWGHIHFVCQRRTLQKPKARSLASGSEGMLPMN